MKYHLMLITLFTCLITGQSSPANGCTIPPDSPLTFPLSFEVVANEIDLVAYENELNFGGIWAGQNAYSNQAEGHPRCTVENRGYATVDFTVSATCGTGWTLGSTLGDYGQDRVVLAGVFTAPAIESESAFPNGRDLAGVNFGDNDVITALQNIASQTVLAIDPGAGGTNGDDSDLVKGFNVVPYASQIRHLRFMVQAPTSDTTGVEQTVVIIIGALLR